MTLRGEVGMKFVLIAVFSPVDTQIAFAYHVLLRIYSGDDLVISALSTLHYTNIDITKRQTLAATTHFHVHD